MGYRPGEGGRPKGAVNKTTRAVREVFAEVFDRFQTDPACKPYSLYEWGRRETTEFYKLCGKLIPADINATGNLILNVVTGVPQPEDDETDDLC